MAAIERAEFAAKELAGDGEYDGAVLMKKK